MQYDIDGLEQKMSETKVKSEQLWWHKMEAVEYNDSE